MEGEFLCKIFACVGLSAYLGVVIAMLIYFRPMVHNFATRLVYAMLCFWLFLVAKDYAYFFNDLLYDDEVKHVLMSIDLWSFAMIAALLVYAQQPRWLSVMRLLYMMLPFVLFTFLGIITKGNESVFVANRIYAYLFATTFALLTFRISFKHDKYINANYSYMEHINVRWVRVLVVLLYALSLSWFLVVQCSTWIGNGVYYLTMSGFMAVLFYFSFRHRNIFVPNYMSVKAIFSDEDESLPNDDIVANKAFAEIEERLERAIVEDKIYLNPQLSLNDLANHIGTNRTYLSRYINNYKSIPFIQYINNIRVGQACIMLKDPSENISISELYSHCGFASYSTFRRVFKAKYGCTPSEYLKS